MYINAEKCLSNGGNWSYTIQFHINTETAPVVREIFEQYVSGKTVTEIKSFVSRRFRRRCQYRIFFRSNGRINAVFLKMINGLMQNCLILGELKMQILLIYGMKCEREKV